MTASPIPFVSCGAYPVRGGNRVRPLVDGEPAFRRICEAIDSARRRVWVTVTYMWPTFRMPDSRGSALDVLDRAAARGVDVRMLFWRVYGGAQQPLRNTFAGTPDERAWLQARGSGVKIRWDRAHPGFCQHQKSWLIDAGAEGASAFVGGINLNPHAMAAPGHHGEGQSHDVYLEIAGPATVDVHHNFVQRWNEASDRLEQDGRWGAGSQTALAFPARVPDRQGDAAVQIQRTVHAGRYTQGPATPAGTAFDTGAGEHSNLAQYRAAIDAARSAIYIENQYLDVLEIVTALDRALQRGAEVVVLLPARPDIGIVASDTPERQALLAARAALGAHENFTLAGIFGLGADGQRKPVYVHAKLMLVDDAWATVGSCNLHRYSLFGNSELNAAFHSPQAVRALRVELFAEHLGLDTAQLDARAALQEFRAIAQRNQALHARGDPAWQGLALALDPALYGR